MRSEEKILGRTRHMQLSSFDYEGKQYFRLIFLRHKNDKDYQKVRVKTPQGYRYMSRYTVFFTHEGMHRFLGDLTEMINKEKQQVELDYALEYKDIFPLPNFFCYTCAIECNSKKELKKHKREVHAY